MTTAVYSVVFAFDGLWDKYDYVDKYYDIFDVNALTDLLTNIAKKEHELTVTTEHTYGDIEIDIEEFLQIDTVDNCIREQYKCITAEIARRIYHKFYWRFEEKFLDDGDSLIRYLTIDVKNSSKRPKLTLDDFVTAYETAINSV